MPIDELMHKPRAIELLSHHLQQGTLILFLGAGASSGIGLPGWLDFVNCMRDDVGLSLIKPKANAEELQTAADEVKEKMESNEKYYMLLKKCLYINMPHLSWAVLNSELLNALGALLIGSKRGNIRRVVTLNFDSILERYLSLYGFVVRVVFRLPELEGSEDVRIYHPHGFLPHPSLKLSDSEDVMLGLDSVNKRLGTPGDPWWELTRHLLRSGVCLFVGMSERTFRDRALAPLLAKTGEEIHNQRLTGVWFLLESISDSARNQFIRNNVVPLEFKSEKEIIEFLLGICQKAAGYGIRI